VRVDRAVDGHVLHVAMDAFMKGLDLTDRTRRAAMTGVRQTQAGNDDGRSQRRDGYHSPKYTPPFAATIANATLA